MRCNSCGKAFERPHVSFELTQYGHVGDEGVEYEDYATLVVAEVLCPHCHSKLTKSDELVDATAEVLQGEGLVSDITMLEWDEDCWETE